MIPLSPGSRPSAIVQLPTRRRIKSLVKYTPTHRRGTAILLISCTRDSWDIRQPIYIYIWAAIDPAHIFHGRRLINLIVPSIFYNLRCTPTHRYEVRYLLGLYKPGGRRLLRIFFKQIHIGIIDVRYFMDLRERRDCNSRWSAIGTDVALCY